MFPPENIINLKNSVFSFDQRGLEKANSRKSKFEKFINFQANYY